MIHIDFVIRQISRSSKQATVFILCVGLSLITLTAFTGFSKSVNQSLRNDARKLHAADIIIRSYEKISPPLNNAVADLVQQRRIQLARYHEFYSVVRTVDDDVSLLSRLKVVEKGYPFYGKVVLQSGRLFHEVLSSGHAIVAQTLLDRLGVEIGDSIQVGFVSLSIVDVVLLEPDRPVNFFSFGPRIFISSTDLDSLGLLQTGSRIRYVYLLKVEDPLQTDPIAEQLKQVTIRDQERVDTFLTAQSRVKRFFDNFVFFLKLVGIFILIIAGVGIQSTLNAFLNEKQHTIAVMKAVGATNRHITLHFMLVIFLLGTMGMAIGIFAGIMLQRGLAWLLVDFLPPDMPLSIAWMGVLESVVLGFAVVTIFTFIPLYRLRNMRPIMIFRKDVPMSHNQWPVYVSGVLFTLFFFGLVFWHMQDIRFGFYFVAGIGGLILLAFLLTYLMLKILKRLQPRRLAVRQAIKGLFRQNSATQSIIVTLSTSLCIIFSIYLIEQNLDRTFIKSYPADAPNLFFVDIQPSQVEAFSYTINKKVPLYPVVRARVVSINDKVIDRKAERKKRRDNLARVFNLTYRHALLEDEILIQGKSLFRDDWLEPQVSILDTVLDMHKMRIGDTILFKIQGVPLKARISSIRSRTRDSLSPFFYFVFQEEILESAPHTVFSVLRVEKNEVGSLQTRIVKEFPNISVIDLSDTIQVFAKFMKQLSTIVRGFSLLSMVAGVLILISAVFATRAERITESVYYKILGAKKSFVVKTFALENVLMGILSGFLALVISQLSAWSICRFVLDIDYHAFVLSSIIMIATALILINIIGIVSVKSILEKKPISYLREQPDA